MTVAEKRVWLEGYAKARAEVARLKERYATAKEECYSLGQSMNFSGTRSTAISPDSKLSRLLERSERRREECLEAIQRQMALQDKIEAAIDRLADDRQRDVLRYRYVDGLTVRQTADRLHYSEVWIYRLAAFGIMALEVPESPSVPEERGST